jgi:hypothetical protein
LKEEDEQFFFLKPSKLMQKREKEGEIDSWIPLVDFLPNEDRQLLNDIVQEASNYFNLIECSEGEYTTDASLLNLLISNQKTINSLSRQIAAIVKDKNAQIPIACTENPNTQTKGYAWCLLVPARNTRITQTEDDR